MKLIILILFFVLSLNSALQAYPLFFKCDKDKQMTEFLSGKELLDGLKKMQESFGGDQKKLIASLCQGKLECERNLTQMMSLINISKETVKIEREKSIAQLNKEMSSTPIKKVSAESFELEKNIRSLASDVNSCRQTSIKLDPNLWEKDECISFYYPFKNEYSYASGFKIKNNVAQSMSANGNGCVSKSALQLAIKKAYLMGVDPLVYLSIGLMEGGAGGWTQLYLDPIGVMKAMGCQEKKSDINKNDKNKLASFGNFHQIAPGLIKNSDLSNRMQNYFEKSNVKVTTEKKYLCTPVTEGNPQIVDKVNPTQCCLELSFKIDDISEVPKLLTMEYLHKMSSVHPYNSSDPAFQMQYFNGFSKLMGGAEGVAIFRSGVDYTKSPAYGYQAVDFILNNLAGNPWLVRELENQKKELKLDHTPSSLLCQSDSSNGANYIDSRHYFDLHRNSARMISIKNKPYDQMSAREKKVIDGEIKASIKKNLFPKMIKSKLVPTKEDLEPNLMDEVYQSTYTITKSTNPSDKVIMKNFDMNAKPMADVLDKEKLQNGYSFKNSSLDFTVTPINQLTLSSINSNWKPGSVNELIYNNKPPYEIQFADGTSLSMNANFMRSCKNKLGAPIYCSELGNKLAQSFKCILADGKGFEVNVHTAKVPLFGADALPDGSEIEDAKITYSNGDWALISEKSKKMIMTKEGTLVDPSTKASGDKDVKKATKAELVDYYFKNIYQSRNTIEKASSYGPWKEFTDDEIKLMADALHKGPQGNLPPGFGSGGGIGGGYGAYGDGMSGGMSGYGGYGGSASNGSPN